MCARTVNVEHGEGGAEVAEDGGEDAAGVGADERGARAAAGLVERQGLPKGRVGADHHLRAADRLWAQAKVHRKPQCSASRATLAATALETPRVPCAHA